MRKFLPIAAAVFAVAGCAHLAPFQPVDATQSVEWDHQSAVALAGGVRLTVHPDDWSGSPRDLDHQVTPVEVLVENGSGHELALLPRLFSLVGPTGIRYRPMHPGELRSWLRAYERANAWPYPPWYVGYYGYYPWPGIYRPWDAGYPYAWWGLRSSAPPAAGPTPPPSPPSSLVPGGHASVLLFFPVPATSLQGLTFEAQLQAVGGAPLGTLRFPFARMKERGAAGVTRPPPVEGAAPPAAPPPPPSAPPPPPPSAPPPPPPSAPPPPASSPAPPR